MPVRALQLLTLRLAELHDGCSREGIQDRKPGRIHGTVIRVHTQSVDWHGYVHHATSDEPQYEWRSDPTGYIALHKGSALQRERD